MKKILVVVLVIAIALIGTSAMATTIVNSKHDLSNTGTTNYYRSVGTNEICVFCHTPHAANNTAPLWNKSTTGSTFVQYTSASVSATMGQPGPISKACLSCHDGTLSVSAVLNQPGSQTITEGAAKGNVLASGKISGNPNLGTDLTNDHPVSFTYNGANPTLKPMASAKGLQIMFYGTGKDQVECASCHAVHDPQNVPFLRLSNAGSNLCLACHNK